MNLMQLRNLKNQIKQKIEEALLNMTLDLEKLDMIEADLESVQSNVLYDDFDLTSLTDKLLFYLVHRVELVSEANNLDKVNDIQEISQNQKMKLVGLQKQEEEYNKNVQVVVESDEQ